MAQWSTEVDRTQAHGKRTCLIQQMLQEAAVDPMDDTKVNRQLSVWLQCATQRN